MVQPPTRYRPLMLLLMAAAVLLRVYAPEQYPLAVNQDELSNIYDGYCLSRNGTDRWGHTWPLLMKGFGGQDYRPPLMAWLIAAPSALAGFTVGGGRLVSATLGIASLLLLYAFCRRWRGSSFALLATAIAAFSPWHLQYSRLAHEGAMLPVFFCILLLYLWQRSREEERPGAWTIAAGFSAGLSLLSYHSAKGLLPVFTLLFVADAWQQGRLGWRRVLYFLLPLLVGAFPALIALYQQPKGGLARIRGQQIIAPDVLHWLYEFAANYWRNLSPQYLFLSSGKNNNLTLARLLPVELPFFYAGIMALLRKEREGKLPGRLLLLFAAGALLAACLTRTNPHALRGSVFCILAPVLTAAGIEALLALLLRPQERNLIIARSLIIALLVGNSLWLIGRYVSSTSLRNYDQQHALVLATQRLRQLHPAHDTVYVTNTGTQPELYVQAFAGLPADALTTWPVQTEQKRFLQFRQLGKFYFVPPATMRQLLPLASEQVLFLSDSVLTGSRCIDSLSFDRSTYYFCDKNR